MTSKRWLVIFSVILLSLPYSITNGCGWGPEPEEYRFSTFNPLTLSPNGYRPFFFTWNFLNACDNTTQQRSDRDRNIDDWMAYLKNKNIPRESVFALLYETGSSAFNEALKDDKRVNAADNAFLKFLKLPANKQLLRYIIFSKQCERYCSERGDAWEEEVADDIPIELLDTLRLQMNNAPDRFLRKRYAFQLLRLAYYTFTGGVVEVYKKEFAKADDKDILKAWAMLYYANSLTPGSVEASYYYARVFRLCDEKKKAAYNHFIYDDYEKVLLLAKNNEERADILALAALERPARKLNFIKQIVDLSPNHPALELLITREINKLEDQLLSDPINNFGPAFDGYGQESTDLMHAKYALDVATYVAACSNNKKFKNKEFLTVAAAHLQFLAGNDGEALAHLDNVSKKMDKADEGLQLQYQLTRLMAEAHKTKSVDAVFEARVYEAIAWLNKHSSDTDTKRLLGQFMSFLSYSYLQQGNVAKAALCRMKSGVNYNVPVQGGLGYYGDYGDEKYVVAAMLRYLYNTGKGNDAAQLLQLVTPGAAKTNFNQFLATPFFNDGNLLDPLREMTASLYLRDDSIEKAYEYLNQIHSTSTYWQDKEGNYARTQYLDANPFHAKAGNNHRHNSADTVKYNPYEFVYWLLKFKGEAARTGDAKIMLKIAHAYYNMTNYGNSWILVREYQSNNVWPRYKYYTDDYYGCNKARSYYLLAYNAARDAETKAACCIMIAQCDKNAEYWAAAKKQKDDYYPEIYTEGVEHKKFNGTPYFQEFVANYRHTDYYNNLINECGGRKEFIWAFKTFAY